MAQVGLAPQRRRRDRLGMPRVSKGSVGEALVGAEPMKWLLSLPPWRGVLALAYHRIRADGAEPRFDSGLFSATTAELDEQMAILVRNFELVSPETIARDPDARARRVVVTFDDGYRDNHELALPILRRHGVPAAFFLATGFIDSPSVPWWDELAWMVKGSGVEALQPGEWLDKPVPISGDRAAAIRELGLVYKRLPGKRTEDFLDYCGEATGMGRCSPREASDLWMTWDMAREVRDAGMTIGGHTVTHPILGRAEPEVQRAEVEDCARRLREELDVPMRSFAYPVGLRGTFDDVTRRCLQQAEVEIAFSLYGGYLRPGELDRYDVPRASVELGATRRAFRAMLTLPRFFARW